MPAEAEARVAPMAGQAVRVVNVSVDEGLFSSVGRACATSGIEAVGKRVTA